jgi:FkbM family methyltransferase
VFDMKQPTTLRPIYRRVRRAILSAVGRDIRFPIQANVPAERHGSEYGGWWICPLGLGAGSVVYSVGIGTDITFDLSLIETHGVTVHAFDPTPGSIAYLKARQLPNTYKWHGFGVASHDGQATFFPPANPAHISHTLLHRAATSDRTIQVEVRRLSTIVQDLGHKRIDVLKMDIEGAEYDVLEEILQNGLAVQQILVEFHHRFPEVDVDRTRRAVKDLNAAGYRIFSASECGDEYGFVLCSRESEIMREQMNLKRHR